jgi:SAM-dependent methyltransferase
MSIAPAVAAIPYRPARERLRCALCEGHLHEVLNLGEQPLANGLLSSPDEVAPVYPLRLGECSGCRHVQLMDEVDPEAMFRQYVYRTGASAPAVRHFQDLAAAIRKHLHPSARVFEIGSGDGTLLTALRYRDLAAVGVDPSSVASDVPETEPYFLDPQVAGHLVGRYGRAEAVVMANVLAHVSDPAGLVADAAELLNAGGLLVIEAPYLQDMVANGDWSSCYAEHAGWFSFKSIAKILCSRFVIERTEHLPVHGGSLRVWARKKPCPTSDALPDAYRLFAEPRVDWERFSGDVERHVAWLREVCDTPQLVGYGCPAKATVILNRTGIRPSFVTDTTEEKIGRWVPGVNVPIRHPNVLKDCDPTKVLLLAWNYREAIMGQEQRFAGKWIVPFPWSG